MMSKIFKNNKVAPEDTATFPLKKKKTGRSKLQITLTPAPPRKRVVFLTSNSKRPDRNELRELMKKRHFSAISLFLNDWKAEATHEIVVVPDPIDRSRSNLIFLLDTAMSFYVAVFGLVICNLNILHYLIKLHPSFVATEGQRFFEHSHFALNFSTFVLAPLPMAAGMILIIGHHEPSTWTRRMHICYLVFRYLFKGILLGYLGFIVIYWTLQIEEIPKFLHDPIWNSFKMYANNSTDDEAAKIAWEYTQSEFECCGVNSHEDFKGTPLLSKGVRYCLKKECNSETTFQKPKIVPAYPLPCCERDGYHVCITGPRADQVWKTGCMERAVTWVKTVASLIVGINSIILLLNIANLILIIFMDVATFGDSEKRENEEMASESELERGGEAENGQEEVVEPDTALTPLKDQPSVKVISEPKSILKTNSTTEANRRSRSRVHLGASHPKPSPYAVSLKASSKRTSQA